MEEQIPNYLLIKGFYAPFLGSFQSEFYFILHLSLIQFPCKGQDKVKQVHEHLQNRV